MNYRLIGKRVLILFLDLCICIALFADTASTGNLSMSLNGDGIYQAVTFIVAYLLLNKICEKEKEFFVQNGTKGNIVFSILALFFSIFMLIGKYEEKDADLKYVVIAIPMLIGYFVFFFIGIELLTKWIKRVQNNQLNSKIGKVTRWIFEEHVVLGASTLMILCRLPYLILFYPGSMTWDGGVQICSFLGKELFTNHHPPLISFIYGPIAKYSDLWNIPNVGMFVIPVMQTLVSTWAIIRVCQLMRDRKIHYWIRWCALVYYSAFTVWCISDVTVIKDSLYYPFTLLFFVQVAYCLYDKQVYFQKKTNMLFFVVDAILVCEIRNNGIFVVIFTMFLMFFAIGKNKKVFFTLLCAVSIGVVLLLDKVVYPAAGVITLESKVDTYCIMYQQTAAYYAKYPDDVTEEEYRVLNALFDYEKAAKEYDIHLADWVKNCMRVQEGNPDDPTASEFVAIKNDYLKVWLAQGLRHPLNYISTFIDCSYGYYYPEVNVYIGGMGEYESDRNIFTPGTHRSRQIESFALGRFALEQLTKLQYFPVIGLLYRAGFYTWCVMYVVALFIIQKRYKELILTIPAAVNILVCLVSPINWCIRYTLPTMCMVPILLALLIGNEYKEA